MLNLLFISDNPKIENIKNDLQPFIKVIIDVVPDFDSGLRDVFEKRPATVCIQEHIGAVAGESVARHIQLLLGNSAPTFILLHAGNDKVKPTKGLFEHIINLGQPSNILVEEIKNTLKLILGDKWGKIYIPPTQLPASTKPSPIVSTKLSDDADKLVDDFFDPEMSNFPLADDQPHDKSASDDVMAKPLSAIDNDNLLKSEAVRGSAEADRAQSINDDLAELLLMELDKARHHESSATVDGGVNVAPEDVSTVTRRPEADIATPLSEVLAKSTTAPATKIQTAVTPAASEFRISGNMFPDEDLIAEDILLDFEQSYRSETSKSRRSVVIVITSIICIVFVMYLVKQKPQLLSSLKQRVMPSLVAEPATLAAPAAVPVQNQVTTPVPVVTVQPLPAFLPKNGYDASYAVKNPGWERYVGTRNEFRVFKTDRRIKAVQVLAGRDASVSEPTMKSVLQELAGSAEYMITAQSTKAGIHIESGTILNRGEIIIYKKNGMIKAFVVSVD